MAKATEKTFYDHLCKRYPSQLTAEEMAEHFGYNGTCVTSRLLKRLQERGAVVFSRTRPRKYRAVHPLSPEIYRQLDGSKQQDGAPPQPREDNRKKDRKEENEMKARTREDSGNRAAVLSKMISDAATKLKEDLELQFKQVLGGQEKVDKAVGAVCEMVKTMENIKKEVASIKATQPPRVLIIHKPNKKKIELKEHRHKCFDRILQLVSARKPIFLAGPSGCGKTWAAEQVAKALGLKFGKVTCTAGMSEGQLIGGMSIKDGDTGHRGTECLECIETGGVFLADEIDAGDENTLIVTHAMTDDSKTVPVPFREHKPFAVKHEDFVFIATANTMGAGGDRVFVGRNQLDHATINRFHIGIIDVDYDRQLEKKIVEEHLNGNGDATKLLRMGENMREAIEEHNMQGRVWSTRFYKHACELMTHPDCKWSLRDVFDQFCVNFTKSEKAKVKSLRP